MSDGVASNRAVPAAAMAGPAPRTATSRALADMERAWSLMVLEVRKSHATSALGLAWSVASPLLFLGTYYVVFAVIMRVEYAGPGGSIGYVISMFSGLVPWLFFSNCLGRGGTILASHGPLVKQINFPIHVLPFVMVGEASVEFFISVALLLGLAAAAGLVSAASLLVIPASVILMAFLVPLSYLMSCYNVLLPDLGKLVPTALRVGIFMTPVLWLPTQVDAGLRLLVYLNPMSYFITPFRYAFLGSSDAMVLGLWADMLIAAAFAGVAGVLAWLHRGFVRRTVVDYL